MSVYLDCNATTPVEPAIADDMLRWFVRDFGNAGSRTHEFGTRAKQAVNVAREQVAAVVGASREDILFTSGATESNNLAILGLAPALRAENKRHIISSAIEHKAVLEPLERLHQEGFELTLLKPDSDGRIDPAAVKAALRPDTGLVSLMHVNNETGVIQPIEAIGSLLGDHPAYFHVDAAQSFGKLSEPLRSLRIDLMSISGHKIYGPKGVGALVMRKRGFRKLPLTPLMWGGGQERGLRPGTLPTPLIVGLGMAAELSVKHGEQRLKQCLAYRERLLEMLSPLEPVWVGSQDHRLPTTLSLRFPGLDSEAVMVALKGVAAFSNGSACTSASYSPSHVLLAMGLDEEQAQETFRLSWCHLTEPLDSAAFQAGVRALR